MRAALMLLTIISLWNAINAVSIVDYNVEELRDNNKRLDALLACVIDEGDCNELDGYFKGRVRKIISTKCGGCTDKEITTLRDMALLFLVKRPNYLPKVFAVYKDKEGIESLLNYFLIEWPLQNHAKKN